VTAKQHVIVVGLGEVGRPLFELASRYHHTLGVDIAPLLDPYQSVPNMRKQSNAPFVSVSLSSFMLSMPDASALAAKLKNLSDATRSRLRISSV